MYRYRPTALELKVLRALKELGEGDGAAVGTKIVMGSAMTDYLCRYLTTKELVRRAGRKYALTSLGEEALEEAFIQVLNLLKAREEDVVAAAARIGIITLPRVAGGR
ncbi:MAG: hypothetical protein ACE5JL_01625 [Dehalococcoidia bacterium]